MNLNLAAARLKMPLLLTAFAVFSMPSWAEDTAVKPINVQVSLASSAITQGEPIVLGYKITNTTSQSIETYMGRDEKGWLTFRLTDATGKPVAALTDARRDGRRDGIYVVGPRLEAKSETQGSVIVSQYFLAPHTGTYRLSVSVHLPYAMEAQSAGIIAERFEQTFGTAVAQESVLTFTVTPPDPIRLRTVAASLTASLPEKTIAEKQAAIEALFSMPEADALPVWKALAHDPKLDSFTLNAISKQLARLNTMQSAELLIDMIENPAQPPAVRRETQIGIGLTEMYVRNADGPLKRRVGKFFTSRGLALPNDNLPFGN